VRTILDPRATTNLRRCVPPAECTDHGAQRQEKAVVAFTDVKVYSNGHTVGLAVNGVVYGSMSRASCPMRTCVHRGPAGVREQHGDRGGKPLDDSSWAVSDGDVMLHMCLDEGESMMS
jgi:hypothetical protein